MSSVSGSDVTDLSVSNAVYGYLSDGPMASAVTASNGYSVQHLVASSRGSRGFEGTY